MYVVTNRNENMIFTDGIPTIEEAKQKAKEIFLKSNDHRELHIVKLVTLVLVTDPEPAVKFTEIPEYRCYDIVDG